MSARDRMGQLDADAPVLLNPYPTADVALHRVARLAHEELCRQEAAQRASEHQVWRWVATVAAAVLVVMHS